MESFLSKDTCNLVPIDGVLLDVDKLLDQYFSSVSLADLIEKQKESYANDYSI